MEIVRDFLRDAELPTVRHYHPGELRVLDTAYEHSIIVTPHGIIDDWPPQTSDELVAAHLARLLELEPRPEVVLLGTGERQQFPPRAVMAPLLAAGVGVEIMATAPACRTWNIVLAEGRRAAAALIIR